MISVFVYGTLLTGEANHGVAEPYLDAAAPGAVRGVLVDNGDYPALLIGKAAESDPDAVVYGEWLTISREGLQAMDELEQYYGPGDLRNDYERVRITDVDGIRSGWVYIWSETRGCPPIRSGSWRER